MLDVDKLLEPVSDEAPCGENLEYDPAFLEMEQAAQPKPDQQFGDTIVPGAEPEWRLVKSQALDLLQRTRDLRVLMYLTHAVLHIDGLLAFRDCLSAIHRLVDERWESVHPQLDPDDDNDPTLRVNLIASLNDGDTTLKYLRESPLVQAKTVGRFSMRDYDLATGELAPAPTREGEPPPDLPKPETIQAAFLECDLDELQASATAAREAAEAAANLENALTRQVGVTHATGLGDLRRLLQRMVSIYDAQLERRGIGVPTNGEAEGDGVPGTNGSGQPQRLTGEISSREDVIRAIDKICDYYQRYEPSSPVPLLLRRAKRLANKSFLEIVRDLSPDMFQQILALGGEEEGAVE